MDMSVQRATSPQADDTPARWGAVISLTLGVFGLVTAEFLPVSLLTPLSADLGVGTGVAGQSITTTAVIAAIAGPGVIIGTRNIDRRWTVLALTTLLIISSLLAAVANHIVMLLAARVLLGIGLGGFWAMSAALAMRLVPPARMPRAMAIIMAGVSLATVCAAPLGAWLGSTLGWRSAFYLSAAVGVVALAVQAFTLPALPPTGHAGLGTLAALMRRPAIRTALFTILLFVAGHFAGFTYIRPFLERVPKLDVETISLILLGYGIAGFVGNILGGIVSERSARLSVTIFGSLVAVSALILAIGGASLVVSAVAIALWGLAFGAFPVSIQSFVVRHAPDEAESAGALVIPAFQIAISSGAVLGGILIETQGPIAVISFLGLAALAGTSVMAARGERRRLSLG
ncbi:MULTISPECIES: MFS transporter [Rhizobium/Agrobacterium group]|jgi:predicted MFS family arabinose efflux permease|uniref:MFS transporter n=2 Tax=Rhizobium/Agrobacterium group TaxID=227290 RepID=UPI0008A73045|nr:putative MFS family arabinose efflux permease [Rhizobium sp. PvP014]MBP2528738.1 putative MFS family arabinose efflux permease [Rhizobium sp. PvP099]NSY17921.1 MFS transporter [Neorhizobium sp. AL 9.2.2]SEH22870.1 Predicted arabinose efflux permease, MFS family [Rhizobium sp. NFR12]